MAFVPQAIASTSRSFLRKGKWPARSCPHCFSEPTGLARTASIPLRNATGVPRRFQSSLSDSNPALETHYNANDLPKGHAADAASPAATPLDDADLFSTTGVLPSSNAEPTAEDLLAFRPMRLRPPKPYEHSSTPDFAIYSRKFENTLASIEKAFKKDQIVKIAKNDLDFPRLDNKTGKRRLIRRIMAERWELPDPELWIAREKKEEKNMGVEVPSVEQSMPLSEKEVFFLLGKLDGRELLRQLATKCSVKLSIFGDAPGNLKIVGTADNVQKLQEEWASFQAGLVTAELPTELTENLGSNLLKPLSIVTETFVATSRNDPSVVQVTCRGSDKNGVQRVETMLWKLAKHNMLQENTPRAVLIAPDDAMTYAMIPFLTREPAAWNLSALPLYGLKRWQSLGNARDLGNLHGERNFRAFQAEKEDIKEALISGFPTSENLDYSIHYGNHLYIDPDTPDRVIDEQAFEDISESVLQTTFVPSTPPNILDTHRASASASMTSTSIRRLLYRNKTARDFIRLERPMAASKELEKEEGTANLWRGRHGKEAYYDILLPDRPVDVRLVAASSEAVADDILEQVSDVRKQNAPQTIEAGDQTYHLYEDQQVRSTRIDGLGEPWNGLEVVIERSSERTGRGARTAGALVYGTSIERLLQCVQRV